MPKWNWQRSGNEYCDEAECPECQNQDRDGRGKIIYKSEIEAQKRADYKKRSENLRLYPYKCPYGYGWHLTKG